MDEDHTGWLDSTAMTSPANVTPGPAVSNTTLGPDLYDFWEMHAARFLYAVPSIIFLLLGSVGNTLSFIVFNSNTMRQTVTSMYFRVLAISDTVVLFSGGLVFFIYGAFDHDIRLVSVVSCKFWIPLLLVACYHSCWILVFIAIDRFIGVYRPHKYKKYCSQKQAVISMVILLIINVSTVGVFWALSLELNADHTVCGIGKKYAGFFHTVFVWLDLAMLNIVPTIVLVTLNICIIIKISRAASARQNTMGMSGTGGASSKKVGSPTLILLSVSLVYFLCTIPSSTAFLVKRSFSDTPHGSAQVVLYVRSCETLYLANHAVNFLLYCVHGTGFRKELVKLFKKPTWKILSSGTGTESTSMSSTRKSKIVSARYTKREDAF